LFGFHLIFKILTDALKYKAWQRKKMICLDRDGSLEKIRKCMKEDGIQEDDFILISSDELQNVSSSEIREQMKSGEFKMEMMNEKVINFINEKGKSLFIFE
jgi:nicotinic acid mononucleotide adenylyltransferase